MIYQTKFIEEFHRTDRVNMRDDDVLIESTLKHSPILEIIRNICSTIIETMIETNSQHSDDDDDLLETKQIY